MNATLKQLGALALAALFLAPTASASPIRVDRLPGKVVTTIAIVTVDADGKGATVHTDKDIRVFHVGASMSDKIAELVAAKKNRWEVRFEVEPTSTGFLHEVKNVQIVSRSTRLTTGFNMPDTDFYPITYDDYSDIETLFGWVYSYKQDEHDTSDNCFNRAQYWSRMWQIAMAQQGSPAGTDKAFIFFTPAFRARYQKEWWYHVAPVVYHGNSSNPIVLDPSYMDGPAPLSTWLATFDTDTGGACQRIETMEQFEMYNDEPICLYTTAAMFNYGPSDLNTQLSNWRCTDFNHVMNEIPAPNYGSWSDGINAWLMPEMCGGLPIGGSNSTNANSNTNSETNSNTNRYVPSDDDATDFEGDEVDDTVNDHVDSDDHITSIYGPSVGDRGTVTATNANLRAGPGKEYDVITVVSGGTGLTVLGVYDNNWYHVQLDDGFEGFLAGSVFE